MISNHLATDHTFYQFTGLITHVGMLEEEEKFVNQTFQMGLLIQ